MNIHHTTTRMLCVLASVLLTSSAFSDEATLQNILDNFIAEDNLTGGILLTSVADERTIVTSGYKTVEENEPVSEATRFYIASSGKTLVATAILSLVQDGSLDLDAPVWSYIQDIDGIDALVNSKAVTLRQLLTHTSGLAEYLDDDFFDASNEEPSKRWNEAEAISFALDFPANAAPNKVFEYTNTNYVLLGHILNAFEGSMAHALEKHVFAAANMQSSTVGAMPHDTNLAHGYSEDKQNVSAQAWASALGDGPVVSTVGDIEAFLKALFQNQSILDEGLLAEMTSGSDLDDSYGLGIGIDGDRWGEWFGHAGSYDGFEADFRYYPEDDAIMIFMTNGNQETETSILDLAAQEIFSR